MSKNKNAFDDDYEKADSNTSHDSGLFVAEKGMSPEYVKFTLENKKLYLWWNLGGMVCNSTFGWATTYILETHPNECAGIKLASWALFSLYIITFLLQAMCLCGLEKRLCTNMGLLAVIIYDMIVITWA